MSLARWLRPPHRTLTLFVCLMAALGTALGWLAWQLLERDRLLERSQRQERLEQAADRIVVSLQREVDALARLVAATPGGNGSALPDDVVVVRASTAEVSVEPPGRLLFAPGDPPEAGTSPPALATAERAEFERQDPASAASLYAKLAHDPSPATRAAALVGLGRSLRKAGRAAEAIDAYNALEKLGDVSVAGRPAELAAVEGRCSVLADMRRTSDLRQEAERLDLALWSGRWQLSRSAWEFQREQAGRWGARHQPDSRQQQAFALSAAVHTASMRLQAEPGRSGQWSPDVEGQPSLAVWATQGLARTIVVAGPEWLRAAWSRAVNGQRVEGALNSASRRLAAGAPPPPDGLRAVRGMESTGLPWSVAVFPSDPLADRALFASRRRLLVTTFGVLGLALLAGSFFILRSIQRERDVARMQTEFVSAVSHEFRTPLTSLGQLSEMLSKGRVPTDALKQDAYEILARETDRLRRLVESILDFGRIEAGSYRYELATLDAAAVVREVVAELEPQAAAAGFTIDVACPPDPLAVQADRAALSLALRNLVDNAIKYSGASRTVWVAADRRGDRVCLSVRDRGAGIPPAEQRAIYRKFVRGAAARAAGVAGVGIGLAIASQIVTAHRGRIALDSEPGAGSTFTIELPSTVSGGGDSG